VTYALAAARRHRSTSLALVVLTVAILANATLQHDLGRAVLYFAVLALTTWQGAIAETGGSIVGLVSTALSASVPEEFFRFVWQTRLGAWLRNPAVGWLVASALWAMLHAPKDWSDSHSLASTIMGVVNIVPLGLLWGYLTHRSRSMLPAIVLHATNLWGLQNLG
jgi:membrane protease YdiL (CAAX protease family)